MLKQTLHEDSDASETQEWLDALSDVVATSGGERGLYLLRRLQEQAQGLGLLTHAQPYSAYQNSIALERQTVHPGDVSLEERITAIVRWNALAMVVRANKEYGE